MKVNNISFKTFKFVGVNSTELEFKSGDKNCAGILELKEFENIDYGASKDIVLLNREHNDYYEIIKAEKGEKKVSEPLECSFNKEVINDWYDIVAEENSDVEVPIVVRGSDSNTHRNTVIRVLARKNSKVNLQLVRFDSDHHNSLESIAVVTEVNADVQVSQVELSSGKLVTNYKTYIMGDESKVNLDSIYFASGKGDMDLLYESNHFGKKSESNMIINGALVGESSKKLKATLDFKEGSSGSVGNEEEFTLLLSENVKGISVPALLSHEDDVEGNHAASAGKMDKELLFYIMSRGYSLKEAEKLVIESKFQGTIQHLPEALADEALNYIEELL